MKQEIKELLKTYKWKILIQIIFIFINVFFYTYPSQLLGQIIDLLYNVDENKMLIVKLSLIMLGACIGTLLTRMIWKNLEFLIEINMRKQLTNRLFTKLLKSKIERLGKIKNGEIMSYFISDTKTITRILVKLTSTAPLIIAFFGIIIIRMAKGCNPELTLAVMIPLAITIIIVIIIRNKISTSFKKAQESFTQLSEYVQESTDSIRTMKAFVGEEKQNKSFMEKNKKLRKDNLQVSKNQNVLDICINVGFGISYAITLLYGSKLVMDGRITIGDIVEFNSYLILLENPVCWIPWLISRYKKYKISYDRLNNMFNLPEEEIEINNEKKYRALKGDVEIRNLTFHYPGCLEKVLENINISVKKGETLGIIGMIGSGKTTLMNLLLKLYNVERGKIYIDNKDINDIPTEKIREHICYITQDNFLFSASLKENINLFKDEYKNEEIEMSTKNAMIYDDICDMKDGLNTIIGEKGIDLSGGQKQRVVISRAFLSNSDIVIFDDTFSALDNKTEQHLLKNIKQLTKDKTCIIVSNRVSDIKHCNKIIVLDSGEIVESGTHNTLIKNQSFYYDFYKNQSHQCKNEILA